MVEYKDVLSGLRCLPGKKRHNHRQVGVTCAKWTSQSRVRTQRRSAEEDRILRRAASSIAIRKANRKVWVCLNLMDLNNAIQRNHYPLPTIEEVLVTLKTAKICSLVDAKVGFLQVNLS